MAGKTFNRREILVGANRDLRDGNVEGIVLCADTRYR